MKPTDNTGPRKIDQTVMGRYGNCQSACLAMLLGAELSEVPNFAQLAQDQGNAAAYTAQGEWLRERGWTLLTVAPWQGLPWPPAHGYYIAGGASPRGFRHAVIFKDGELWHDPHPSRGGIANVDDVDLLYPLNPTRQGFLEQLISTPEIEDFSRGVQLEAAHQVARWGRAHDRSKSAENWYWLLGYLAGKALRAAITGDREKALHHCVSSAAALLNWHAAIKNDTSGAGIGQDEDVAA